MTKAQKDKQAKNAEELTIIFPDQAVELGGKKFVMRELRFAEQLQHNSLLQVLAKHIDKVDIQGLAVEDSTNAIIDILAVEYETTVKLMAICSGQSIDWVTNLTPAEGEDLILFWWSSNSHFFIRRQMRKAEITAQMRILQAGAKSCKPSSKVATASKRSRKATRAAK